jgi:hypothetical protein
MYVYIFRSVNSPLYKVGHSSDPDRRLKELQTGNPFKIEEYSRLQCSDATIARSIERFIMDRLSGRKSKGGNEWFKIDESALEALLFEIRTRYNSLYQWNLPQ